MIDEIINGSPMTPERRATFERMRFMAGVRRNGVRGIDPVSTPEPVRGQEHETMELPWYLEGVTVLTPEGSAEVLEEIRNGSPDTPERLAMFERMDRRAEIRKRLAVEADAAKLG
ncbi:hypothetical protein [Longimicrobium sp.]|uniref:hypothetical protein n=1 Tax=Longimicrobium sp. TaxID=2029185 RepID=UPI002E2F65CC|nr:hypothetical protein [Longimicrobium sp.]HEX6041199.1 hypothetical protein [Longimicrobium sp.]